MNVEDLLIEFSKDAESKLKCVNAAIAYHHKLGTEERERNGDKYEDRYVSHLCKVRDALNEVVRSCNNLFNVVAPA